MYCFIGVRPYASVAVNYYDATAVTSVVRVDPVFETV